MIGKVVVSVISLILVVGVVIGVVAVTNINHGAKDGSGSTSTSMKALSSVCAPATYRDVCMDTLSGVAQNASASPKDFLKAALQATVADLKSKLDLPMSLSPKTNDPKEKMALETCKDMMQYAIEDAQKAFSMVGDSDSRKINDRVKDLQNWLSAVLSYQGACLNDLSLPEYQGAMENGILNATRLTANALSIVNKMASILSAFDLKLEIPKASRRLLGADEEVVLGHEQDDGSYPEWMSGPDRKLLAAHDNGNVKPNAVVAKDGSGQYKTISAAVAAAPKKSDQRFIIYVKAGIYEEYVFIEKGQNNIFMYGDGAMKTIVTGKKSNAQGISTSKTATFSVEGTAFICKHMGFQNTAGPNGHQAVALRSQSDMSAFFHCRFDAFQDTLYVQTNRQFYRNCLIAGTVDFIFGDSQTIIQNSKIIARLPNSNQQNMVTAQGRWQESANTAIVIQGCRLVPDAKLFPVRHQIPTYLGRPWKQYSRTIIMESVIGDHIRPEGFTPWNETAHYFHDSLYYAEYRNSGPGAVTSKRVNWKGYKAITNRNEALPWTAANFLQSDLWLKNYGEPFVAGLRY